MNEAEFNRLLVTVADAISLDIEDSARTMVAFPQALPVAANDNSREWPLTPFPEGWHACC